MQSQSSKLIKRLIMDAILFIAVFFVPWWLVILCATVAVFIFPSYYEIIVLGIVIDSLYNAPVDRLYHIEIIASIMALVIFAGAEYLKGKLRFYAD